MGKIMVHTGRLFADPSALRGAGTILDLGATLAVYNYSESDEIADAESLLSDWLAVGDDIRKATSAFQESLPVAK